MLVTYHVICAFPACGHTAVSKEPFDWPLIGAPDAEIPQGWSVVLRRGPDKISVIAICGPHDFTFDGVKATEIRPIGFNTTAREPKE